MKTLATILFLAVAVQAFSQTDALSYQAIIIDENEREIPGLDISGNYLAETEVSLQFTIRDQSGNPEYQEIQTVTTDRYGMVNLTIGQGDITPESSGLFNEINWDGSPKQLVVDLSIQGGEFKEFTNEELLFVPYAYHRNVIATGTLDVDGESTLNNALTVTNQSPTLLSGDLTVEGDGFFNTITVENLSDLQGDLQVGGNTEMSGTLDVLNQSPASLSGNTTVGGSFSVLNGNPSFLSGDVFASQDLSVDNTLTVSGESDLNGQVTINASLSGSDTDRDAYPLRVQGANQGIDIRVTGASNNANNFLTFRDANGVKGSIEAQSFTDLQNSFEYQWDLQLFFIDLAFITAEGIAAASQFDFAEAAVCAANSVIYGVHYQNREDYYVDTYGLYFKSGGADYAEYLERADHSAILHKGDIVGVSGGTVSRQTKGANHIMVISTDPIVLGNMPDEVDVANFEKVAFLGQVPVRVVGEVEVGDYILPSGNEDGLGVGKHPDKMGIDDYKNILGVAWEASSSPVMSLINVAVGLNANDVSTQLQKQEERIDELEAKVNEILATLGDVQESPKTESGSNPNPKTVEKWAMVSEADFNSWLEEYGYIFEYYTDELRKEYEERGIDYQRHEEIRKWVEQPLEEMRAMYRGDKMATLWKNFVERYPKQFQTE